jgi:hypothetical protein
MSGTVKPSSAGTRSSAVAIGANLNSAVSQQPARIKVAVVSSADRPATSTPENRSLLELDSFNRLPFAFLADGKRVPGTLAHWVNAGGAY